MTSAAAAAEDGQLHIPGHGLAAIALRRFVSRKPSMAALIVLVGILVAGALAHVIAPGGWDIIDLTPSAIHRPPSLAYPFGTDQIGRNMLVRTLYGVRTTEEVALGGAVLATLLGTLIGAFAGFYGGWLDAIGMRLADLVTAYPAVVLTLAAIVYLGEAYPHDLILIFGGYMWANVARVVRAHVSSLREREFAEAARALGATNKRILFRHILPNAAGTVVVAATSLVGQIILIDATVEFFNYGLPSSVAPSLGNLISDVVQSSFGLNEATAVPNVGWWTWACPGLVLVVLLVTVNLVGDALDAALNPGAHR